MRKSKSTETQIVSMNNDAESDTFTPEICRKHDIEKSTFINDAPSMAVWKCLISASKNLKKETTG